MTEFTRRSLLAAVGVGLASAGCLSDAGGTRSDEGTTDGTTTDGTTTDPATAEPTAEDTTTGDWIAQASNSPDPSHEIRVESELSEARTLRVAVVREATGETVFETTDEFPRGERTLYDLEEADPDGVEGFRVCAELVESSGTATESAPPAENATSTTSGTTTTSRVTSTSEVTTTDAEEIGTASPRRDCVTIETSECYGDAYVTPRDDGSVQLVYTIC